MVQLLGETRDAMAIGCWNQAQKIADDSKDVKPFYIIYAAKPDPALCGATVKGKVAMGGIRQAFRLSHVRPPVILGQLVWFVNKPLSIFQFVPELSSPYDVPLRADMLSDRSEDQSVGLMQKGKDLNVLVS